MPGFLQMFDFNDVLLQDRVARRRLSFDLEDPSLLPPAVSLPVWPPPPPPRSSSTMSNGSGVARELDFSCFHVNPPDLVM